MIKMIFMFSVFFATTLVFAKSESRGPQNAVEEYSCDELDSGSKTLVVRVPSKMIEETKYKDVFIQVKDGTRVLFTTNSGTAEMEDVMLWFSGRQGNKSLSGTVYMDELDQTSVSIKSGKKSRKNFRFDCNRED